MPMPPGSRGAVAFNADELRILRRALALQPIPVAPGSRRERKMQEFFPPPEAEDEATPESGRLRAFLLDALARHRSALPGTATGCLVRLQDALTAGRTPGPDDLAALRRLCAAPVGGPEAEGWRALLHRCEVIIGRALRARPVHPGQPVRAFVAPPAQGGSAEPVPGRLIALAGGRGTGPSGEVERAKPGAGPERKPQVRPSAPEPDRDKPSRRKPGRQAPTPAEVFPPRRRSQPPAKRPEERVAV